MVGRRTSHREKKRGDIRKEGEKHCNLEKEGRAERNMETNGAATLHAVQSESAS